MSAEPRTVLASLTRAAEAWPDRPALVFDEEPLTYRQLEQLSRQYLGELQQLDIEPGETVLVMLGNSPDFVGIWLALASGGYVEVPVNTALVGETLRHVILDSGARMILTEPEFVERIVDARSERLETIAIVGPATPVDAGPLQVVTVRAGDRPGEPVF